MMASDSPRLQLFPQAAQSRADRYPGTSASTVPYICTWRNNLTALSHVKNFYFVACRYTVLVYEPAFPQQRLDAQPIFAFEIARSGRNLSGYNNPRQPHAVNQLKVGFLGLQEVLAVVCDDGDVVAYYTHDIAHAAEEAPLPSDGEGLKFDASHVRPFLVENVGMSAWGIDFHTESRKIAVSSNLSQVTVWAFGLTSPANDSEDVTMGEGDTGPRKDRKETVKNVLDLGRSNIPSVSFCNTSQDPTGRWLVATTVKGTVHFFDLDGPEAAMTMKLGLGPPDNRFGRMMDARYGGWACFFLDQRAFIEAVTPHEATGMKDATFARQNMYWWDIRSTRSKVDDSRAFLPWGTITCEEADLDLGRLQPNDVELTESGFSIQQRDPVSQEPLSDPFLIEAFWDNVDGYPFDDLSDEEDEQEGGVSFVDPTATLSAMEVGDPIDDLAAEIMLEETWEADSDTDDNHAPPTEGSIPMTEAWAEHISQYPSTAASAATHPRSRRHPSRRYDPRHFSGTLNSDLLSQGSFFFSPLLLAQYHDLFMLQPFSCDHLDASIYTGTDGKLNFQSSSGNIEARGFCPITSLHNPLIQLLPDHLRDHRSLRQFDRLNLTATIPELGCIILGSGIGRAVILGLHRVKIQIPTGSKTPSPPRTSRTRVPPAPTPFNTPSKLSPYFPPPASPPPYAEQGEYQTWIGAQGRKSRGPRARPAPRWTYAYTFRLERIVPLHSQERDRKRPEAPLVGIAVGPVQVASPSASQYPSARRRWRLILTYLDHSILTYELSRDIGGDLDVGGLFV